MGEKGETPMIVKARQQMMALLFNAASGRLHLTQTISADSATVAQAITFCDQLIDDGIVVNDELAKDIAETINEDHMVGAGLIPLSTPSIAYVSETVPKRFDLGQNYPNPFNPSTTIRFDLPQPVHVQLKIYDVTGRLVATPVNEPRQAGVHSVVWNRTNRSGGPVASGVYFYRIQAGSFIMTRKMVLLK